MKKVFFIFFIPFSYLFADPDPQKFLDFSLSPSSIIDISSLHQLELEGLTNLQNISVFIQGFKDEINNKYGTQVDITKAINLAKDIICSNSYINEEQKQQFIHCYDLLMNELRVKESGFWPFSKNKKPELELPPKMAVGFICTLAGALMCVIPGGQGAGLTLIGTGTGLIMDGLAGGERPRFVDPLAEKWAPR